MRTKSGPRSGRGGARGGARHGGVKAAPAPELDADLHDDASQQQVPIPTSVRSMRDLCRLMDTATEEVREYLTEEFSIMYECKTCYSIFRSLANLISHKRFYCTTRYVNRPRPADRDYVLEQLTQLVIPTEPGPGPEERWHLGDDGQGPVANGQPCATSVETSIPSIVQGGGGKLRDGADGAAAPPAQDRNPGKEFSVHLERLTKNAVYQTVSYEGTIGDLMSDQVAEVQSLNLDSQVTLGPDGRILSEEPHNGGGGGADEDGDADASGSAVSPAALKKHSRNEPQTTASQYYVCGICSTTYATRKTLSYHMQYMHSKYRMCYPCICCKSTFSKIWNLTRHLCKVHHKSTHQVNKLREIIQKKAFKRPVKDCKKEKVMKPKPEAVSEEPTPKLSRQQQLLQENQIFMENVDGISKTQVCVACGTKFERQAALYSHLQRCPKQLRKLKLTTGAAAEDSELGGKPDVKSEPAKTPGRPGSVPAIAETDDDYDEDDQRVSLMLTDVPAIASHITFLTKGVDTADADAEEGARQVAAERGRSEKVQIVNPYRCGSERDSSTEKKIKIEVRKHYVKSIGSGTRNSVCSVLADDFSEVASPMSAMCYRGENSDSDDGGKGWVDGSEDRRDQAGILELGVPCGAKETCTDDRDPEGAHKRFFFSGEMVDASPKMISILKKKTELNRDDLAPGNTLDVKPEVNESSVFPKKKSALSPHMQKKIESLINANKLQCLTCRKKFKKMTNLRRHVAQHIEWYRYRCTICFVKYFAKYDCVAHVIKSHLKGADRIEAYAFVELLQNQEPDLQTESVEQKLLGAGEVNGPVDVIKNRLEVDIINVKSGQRERMEDSGDCESVPEESRVVERLRAILVGACDKVTTPLVTDLPNFSVRDKRLVTVNSPEELNVKSGDKTQVSSSTDVNGVVQENQTARKGLVEEDLNAVFGRYLSEKGSSSHPEVCSKLCGHQFDTPTSCCEINDVFVDDRLPAATGEGLLVKNDVLSGKSCLEINEVHSEVITDPKGIETTMNNTTDTSTTKRVEGQVNVPVVDRATERISLPQDTAEKDSLLYETSSEEVVSSLNHVAVDAGSPSRTIDCKLNTSRCSVEKRSALTKVIDKLVSHGRDVSSQSEGFSTNLQKPRDSPTKSVLFEFSGVGNFSVDDQTDSSLPVVNHEDHYSAPEVSAETETDDIIIEYEGKRVTAGNRDGRFIPRKRRGRIGSDSSRACESSNESSFLLGGSSPSKRKRTRSESRGGARRDANACFDSNRGADAGSHSELAAKSPARSVGGSPLKDMAVQQMVMQVIFGSNNGQAAGEDFTLNGDVFVPKGGDYCPSVAGSTSTASSSPNWAMEDPASGYDSTASPDSDAAACARAPKAPGAGGSARKRLRPVRNRVKVEREDFIYDYGLSDICAAQKEKVAEDAKRSNKRKEPFERCDRDPAGRANVRNAAGPNSLGHDLKLVLPKVTLVRTDDSALRNEYFVKTGEESRSSSRSSSSCSVPGKSGAVSRKKTSATS